MPGAPEAPCRRVVGARRLLDGVERPEGEAHAADADLRVERAARTGAHADETRAVAPEGMAAELRVGRREGA
jgi:hypothetical protein